MSASETLMEYKEQVAVVVVTIIDLFGVTV